MPKLSFTTQKEKESFRCLFDGVMPFSPSNDGEIMSVKQNKNQKSQNEEGTVTLDDLSEEWLSPRLNRLIDKIDFKIEWRLNDNNLVISLKNRRLRAESCIGLGPLFLFFTVTSLIYKFL